MPFSRMAIEKCWSFVCKNSKNILKWMKFSIVLDTIYVMFVHFTIYNTKHNPPKNYKIYHEK